MIGCRHFAILLKKSFVDVAPDGRRGKSVGYWLLGCTRYPDWMAAGVLQPGWAVFAFPVATTGCYLLSGCEVEGQIGHCDFEHLTGKLLGIFETSQVPKKLHCMYIFALICLWSTCRLEEHTGKKLSTIVKGFCRRSKFLQTRCSSLMDIYTARMMNGEANIAWAISSVWPLNNCNCWIPLSSICSCLGHQKWNVSSLL